MNIFSYLFKYLLHDCTMSVRRKIENIVMNEIIVIMI